MCLQIFIHAFRHKVFSATFHDQGRWPWPFCGPDQVHGHFTQPWPFIYYPWKWPFLSGCWWYQFSVMVATGLGRKKYSLLRDKYFLENIRICYFCSKSLNMRSEWGCIKECNKYPSDSQYPPHWPANPHYCVISWSVIAVVSGCADSPVSPETCKPSTCLNKPRTWFKNRWQHSSNIQCTNSAASA